MKVGKTKNITWGLVDRLYPTKVHWSDPREQNLLHTKDTINDKINIQDNGKITSCPRRDAKWSTVGVLNLRLRNHKLLKKHSPM